MKKLSFTVRQTSLQRKAMKSLHARVDRRHLAIKRQQILAMKDNMRRVAEFMALWRQRHSKRVFLRSALQSALNKRLFSLYSVFRDNAVK